MCLLGPASARSRALDRKPPPRERDARNQRDEPPTATKWRMSTHLFLAITLMAVSGANKHLWRTRQPGPLSGARATDDAPRTASGTRGRHALLNSKSGRRAGKDAARSQVGRVDEPDAQRTSRGRYLRDRHQTQEGESVRQANRTPQQWRTRACQILPPPRFLAPLDLCNRRPLRLLSRRLQSHSAAPNL